MTERPSLTTSAGAPLGGRTAMPIAIGRRKPQTTLGDVKADVLADKDPHFTPANFSSVIRGSAWRA
jgi:hypothetical protein